LRRGHCRVHHVLDSTAHIPRASDQCCAPVSNKGVSCAQYFRDVDDALERADEVHVAIEAAVSNEAYGVAAALRGGLAELEARDTVGSVLQVRPR